MLTSRSDLQILIEFSRNYTREVIQKAAAENIEDFHDQIKQKITPSPAELAKPVRERLLQNYPEHPLGRFINQFG